MVSWIPYKDKILNVQTDKKDLGGGQIITHFESTHFKRVGTGGTKELKNAQNVQKHQIGTFHR